MSWLAALRSLIHPRQNGGGPQAPAVSGGAQAAPGEPPAQPVQRNLLGNFVDADEAHLKDIDKKDAAPHGKYRGYAAAWRCGARRDARYM